MAENSPTPEGAPQPEKNSEKGLPNSAAKSRAPKPENDIPHDDRTDELIAYLDGELDPDEAESVATKLSLDPKLRAEADILRKTWDLLDHLPRPEPSENFTAATVSRLSLPAQASAKTIAAPEFPAPSGIGGLAVTRLTPSSPSGSGPVAGSVSGNASARATMPMQPNSASGSGTIIPLPPPSIWSRQSLIRWGIALCVAIGLGYFGRAVASKYFFTKEDNDSLMVNDLRLLKNLRWYYHIDDLSFLKKLDTPDLFGDDESPGDGR